ncbi:putative ankyrin repeat protein [Eutypa lata UCREL1]|uniref:Putative ankyrin repeat protein n=1 Tax=Eutypa lata (strain UCR-EL1) TaxID=1287681 RepID=M7SEW9_EUTLA|nr:putative ankyrin repeat protein [Eutypa lata UCREL1]
MQKSKRALLAELSEERQLQLKALAVRDTKNHVAFTILMLRSLPLQAQRAQNTWELPQSLVYLQARMRPHIFSNCSSEGKNQAVRSSSYAQPVRQSKTPGFLIFGLSVEALACLDHLYERGGPRYLFNGKDQTSEDVTWHTNTLAREPVKVRINVAGGETAEVDADTYIANPRICIDTQHPTESWDINQFLRCRNFMRLTDSKDNNRLMAEEGFIADSLGTNLAHLGDMMVENVMKDDHEGLISVLEEGFYIDAPSTRHGTALQAAASQGNVKIMQLLLDAGADVNATSGQYGTALIASVVEGHFDAMNLLLNYSARPFISGGKYVSALYQGVVFDRLDMVHTLLEKGSWLTTDYGELLDLAIEHSNDEMYELLRYDVRRLHRKLRQADLNTGLRDSVHNHKNQQVQKSISAGALCLLEAATLYNQPGKWTGIKLVRVLRAGFVAGLDKKVLKHIRPYVHSYPAIQQFFVQAVSGSFGGRLHPTRHSNNDEPVSGAKHRLRDD